MTKLHIYLSIYLSFFSTFPRGTCRLSDSSRYLALDGAYHPIWAAFPSNPTLGSKADARRPHRMGLAPAAGGPDRGNSELRETKTNGFFRPMRNAKLFTFSFTLSFLSPLILYNYVIFFYLSFPQTSAFLTPPSPPPLFLSLQNTIHKPVLLT
ncbi:unnamed protein product [Acanthosepion pharaonis]|uniref:Uncharacterized protein n=1 Tax=Acanthosepion pharaonis TaxID=158019 RepID=A0A812AVH2_ACAPH|nr:unnamed protein product [Sepia pharaonis]